VLSQGDLPLVVTRSCALPGKHNQCPTALEALALKVPSSSQWIAVAYVIHTPTNSENLLWLILPANGGDSAIIHTPTDVGWRWRCCFAYER
jgi:hypothetical protein